MRCTASHRSGTPDRIDNVLRAGQVLLRHDHVVDLREEVLRPDDATVCGDRLLRRIAKVHAFATRTPRRLDDDATADRLVPPP
jgi:hypothetical protein